MNKHIASIMLSTLIFCSAFVSAEQVNLGSTQNFLNDKANIQNLDFEELSNQSAGKMVKGLLDLIKNQKGAQPGDQCKAKEVVVIPNSQGQMIVNGELCHFGNYNTGTIVTILQGPHFGLQAFVTYDGVVVLVNQYYFLDVLSAGTFIRHEYDDCTVITGNDQIVIFY